MAPGAAPPIVHTVLRSPGQPLDEGVRRRLEPHFGRSFDRVRVHSDPQAAESARSVQALAYTVGEHVVFGEGRYAPGTDAGQRLIAHELAHTLQQRRASPLASGRSLEIGPAGGRWEAEAERIAGSIDHPGASPSLAGSQNASSHSAMPAAAWKPGRFFPAPSFGPVMPLPSAAPLGLQGQADRAALQARLQQVRQRLAELRRRYNQLSDQFAGSLAQERLGESLQRGREQIHERARSEAAARSLWGGTRAAASIRRAASASISGNTATVTVRLQITYLALKEADAQKRATTDIPRIEAAIRDVWQTAIATGDYAGLSFRLLPKVTYLPRGRTRDENAFLIQVRAPDGEPSSGDSVTGVISLSPSHLEGGRVIVLAHELAHLFGFVDAYLKMTTHGKGGKEIEQWSVARPDPARRPDLLGMIDPAILERLRQKGAVLEADVARQTGPVRVWEEEAGIVLRTLGVAPPPRPRPTPESEDFDPEVELERVRRQGEGKLARIRQRRQRVENTVQSLELAEEIMRLEQEEQSLKSRLGVP